MRTTTSISARSALEVGKNPIPPKRLARSREASAVASATASLDHSARRRIRLVGGEAEQVLLLAALATIAAYRQRSSA
jgi:hypothetical protein